jgi:hypothetical protein
MAEAIRVGRRGTPSNLGVSDLGSDIRGCRPVFGMVPFCIPLIVVRPRGSNVVLRKHPSCSGRGSWSAKADSILNPSYRVAEAISVIEVLPPSTFAEAIVPGGSPHETPSFALASIAVRLRLYVDVAS